MLAQSGSVKRLNEVPAPTSRVLVLGYSERETGIIGTLMAQGCEVAHTAERITSTVGYDLVVSFGYRHIIPKAVIDSSLAPLLNLHISYLPWNRGAHPNFWSFFDCTPSGVSIHLIDAGIDTGPILFQRYVNFRDDETTFSKTHRRLIQEIEDLFVERIEKIVAKDFTAKPQRRKGTYHRASDLPAEFRGWECEIEPEVRRLDSILGRT